MSDSDSFSDLVLELAEEFIDRCRRGERPLLSEYIAKHPQLAAEIREVFPAMAMVERIAIEDDSLERDPVTPAVPELSQIGDYRIIREVGRGGMGVVYEAEQVSLGRRVAVKVLPRTVFDNDRVRQRFARESRAAARLHHTNIVPVFGVGEQDGLQYYVMQFIQGLGLDQVLVELRRLQKTGSSMPGKVMPGKALPQQISAGHLTPERQTPAHADVSADAVARSLMFGRLGETLVLPSDHLHSCGTQQADVKENRPAVASIDANSSTADQGPNHRPGLSDTVAGVLSETARSGEIPLPGQSQVSSGKAPRMPYWRSVATIGADVANALQHAHQQGIVHRDIKPANLLMDMRGNVWVTDFGLAKASDQQDLTHTGDILGTLRYMAPEQFEGTVDHRTDTYALGLTLYELLALRPAFMEKDRHKLMKQVTTETPTPLKTLDSGLPTDLTTIVQKAIDRDPAHRYQSAQELADDLERFLRDEPILARRISPVTRFVRWCKRNPMVSALTTTIAVLLIVVAMGSTLAAFRFEGLANRNAGLVTQKDAALTQANQAQKQADEERLLAQGAKVQAEQAKGVAEAARDQEQELRKEAELQRDRANTNFNRARRAVDQYLAKITENELLSVPGMQPLRKDLLAEALKFYAEFAQEKTDDPELQIELATAQYRLGVIQRELGNKDASISANNEAIQQLETLRDRQLGGIGVQSILAQAYFMAGRYDDCVLLCQKILEADAQHLEVRSTLAESYNSLAIDEKNNNDAAIALSYHQKAFDIRQQLANEHPDNAKYNAELGGTINNIGVLLGEQQKTQDALSMFQLAVTYQEKAGKLSPHSILWGRWHALSLRNAGLKYRDLGQNADAVDHFQKMVEVRQRLVFQNPAVSELRSELYSDLLVLADCQKQLGSIVEANRSYRDAREVMTQIPRETPAELFQLAVVYASLVMPPDATVAATEENPEAADERLRNADLAMQTLQLAVEKGWADSAALDRPPISDALRKRPEFHQIQKIVEAVEESRRLLASNEATEQGKLVEQQKAAEILGKLTADFPQSIEHQRALATTQRSIGVIQTGLKKWPEAQGSLTLAVKLNETLRQQIPNDQNLILDWHANQVALATLYWQTERKVDAHELFQDSLDKLEVLSRLDSLPHAAELRLEQLEYAICRHYFQIGVWDQAVRYARQNLALKRIELAGGEKGHFATLLVTFGDLESHREYCRLASPPCLLRGSDSAPMNPEFLIWMAAHNPKPPIELSVWQESLEAKDKTLPNDPWRRQAMAFGAYRLGREVEVVELLASADFSTMPDRSLLMAISLHALKREDEAQVWLSRAESDYQRLMVNWLASANADQHIILYDGWQIPAYLSFRREAFQRIRNIDPTEDPWFHLIQARGYWLVGDQERAERELAAAASATPVDPSALLARAEIIDRWDHDRAATEWQRTVELAENDPAVWIARGHWYMNRGEHEKADADFAKAASLDPEKLSRFLEAGWWIAGPITEEEDSKLLQHAMTTSTPINPLIVADGQKEIPWRHFDTQDFGRIDFRQLNGPATKYALNILYTDREREETLVLGGFGAATVWINGKEVGRADQMGRLEYDALVRIPAPLRPGKNVVLVKIVEESVSGDVYVRFPEGDLDRGLDYALAGLYPEAAELLANGLQLQPPKFSLQPCLVGVLAIRAADVPADRYRRICDQLLTYYGKQNNNDGNLTIAYAGGLSPLPVVPQTKLLELAEAQLSVDPQNAERITVMSMALYRAGRLQEAWDRLSAHNHVAEEYPVSWPLCALISQKLNDSASAENWLARSRKWYDEQLDGFAAGTATPNWNWPKFLVLLREATNIVEGQPLPDDARLHLWRARSWAGFRKFDKAKEELAMAAKLAPDDPKVSAELLGVESVSTAID